MQDMKFLFRIVSCFKRRIKKKGYALEKEKCHPLFVDFSL